MSRIGVLVPVTLFAVACDRPLVRDAASDDSENRTTSASAPDVRDAGERGKPSLRPCSCADPNEVTDGSAPACDWNEFLWLEDTPASSGKVMAKLKQTRTGAHAPFRLIEVDLHDPTTVQELAARADDLIENGFQLRDNPAVDITKPVDWGARPSADRNWSFKLNSLDTFFQVLAEAYAATQDERYYEIADSILLDWIAYNIEREEPNEMAWDDMAAGKRAIFLANMLDYHLRAADLEHEPLCELLSAAKIHLDFLRDPQYFRTSNHGLFMMMGLQALVHAVPELRDSDAAGRYVTARIGDLLKSQYSTEFIHREHSPQYHLFVTNEFERTAQLPYFANEPRLAGAAEQARLHDYEMFHPNGDLVLIGDSASARLSGPQDILAFLASDGASGTRPPDTSGYYPDVGYAILRSSWDQVPFSEHSFLFFSAAFHSRSHSHKDVFTFEWSERGHPIVIDSGKYGYVTDAWRTFFKSARAGNSVDILGKDFEIADGPYFGSALRAWGRLDGRTRYAEATAYREYAATQHSRLLVLREADWLAVIDVLEGDEKQTYRQWFGFHEAMDVRRTNDGFHATLPDQTLSVFVNELDTSEHEELVLERGKVGDSRQGWVSRNYLERTPRDSAAFERVGTDEVIATVLSLDAPVTEPTVQRNGDTLLFSFETTSGKRAFRYDLADGRVTNETN